MSSLNSLEWETHDHLKRFRPKMFRELKTQGPLNAIIPRVQTHAVGRSLKTVSLDHS